MTDDDSDALGGAPPKLTIGQRFLTALPNLQRAPAPSPPARDPSSERTTRPPRITRAVPTGPTDADADADADDDAEAPEIADSDESTDADDVSTDGAGTGGRASSRLGPSPAKTRTRPVDDLADMTNAEITHRIKKLDDRERFLALTSAPLGVVVGVLLTVVAIHLNPSALLHGKVNPKHESESLILLEGGVRIVLSGIVAAIAMTRRRSLVGFSLLFLGTSMGSPLFALPFWALGGYLIWRVFKYQRVLTARGATTRRSAGTGRVPANPRAAGRAGASAARQRTSSPRRRTKKEVTPTGPPPSKRYTPPRPTRPRPPAAPS
ncbi:MAG: hypothetical protein ABSC30_07610 [Acidimicrobiales bacterium]